MPGVATAIITFEGQGVAVNHPKGYKAILPASIVVGNWFSDFTTIAEWNQIKPILKNCYQYNKGAIFQVKFHMGCVSGIRTIHITPSTDRWLLNLCSEIPREREREREREKQSICH